MNSNTGIKYIGNVRFKTMTRARKSSPANFGNLITVAESQTSNKGTPLLFQSLVNFLIYGREATQIVPNYIDIHTGGENGEKSLLIRRMPVTSRPGYSEDSERNPLAIYSAVLTYNNIIDTTNISGASVQVKLYATLNGDDEMASTTWTMPSGFGENESVLIEWRLGFKNIEKEQSNNG